VSSEAIGSGQDQRASREAIGPEGIQMSREESAGGTAEGARVAGQGSSTAWSPVEQSSCPRASQPVMREGTSCRGGGRRERQYHLASPVLEKSVLVCMLGRGIAV